MKHLLKSEPEMYFFKKRPSKLLVKIDALYKSVISKLPMSNRINYCESLIYRTNKDLLNTKCRLKKRKLRQLLKAAETEIKILQ